MKRLLLLFFGLIIIAGCSVQNVPLKGQYPDKPFEITTNKSMDIVWSNIIDLFAQKGLSIKVIDKSSGLITSEKTSFLNNYSYESSSGTPENPNAWIVISKQSYGGTVLNPQKLSGEWNVRIKSSGDNQTRININVTNIEGTYYAAQTQYTPVMNLTYDGRTTGKFEQMIAEYVK